MSRPADVSIDGNHTELSRSRQSTFIWWLLSVWHEMSYWPHIG